MSTGSPKKTGSIATGGGGGGPHTHPSSDITDLADAVRDVLAAALVAGDNVTITAGESTITIAATVDNMFAGEYATRLGFGSTSGGSWSTSVGSGATASSGSVAIGQSANAGTSTFNYNVSIGYNTKITATRSIAIGYNARSTTPDTVVIKANDDDMQRSNGAGETRRSLYSPDGTKYWLEVEDDGTLTVTEA